MRKPVQTLPSSVDEEPKGVDVSFPAGSFDARTLQASLDNASKGPDAHDVISKVLVEQNQTAIADPTAPLPMADVDDAPGSQTEDRSQAPNNIEDQPVADVADKEI